MTEEDAAIVVRDLLHDGGFRGKLVHGSVDTVESAACGLEFYVITYPRSIQFRAGIEVPKNVLNDLPSINSYNSRFRFAKIYAGESGIYLESDSLINFDNANSAPEFQSALLMWEVSLSTFRDWLREGAGENKGSSESEESKVDE